MTERLLGRRLPDTGSGYLPAGWQAGDYWKVLGPGGRPLRPEEQGGPGNYSSNLTGMVWYVVTPLGQVAGIPQHTVREEADGTISVRAGDGSSNSILVEGHDGTYHGYIEHGVWSEC